MIGDRGLGRRDSKRYPLRARRLVAESVGGGKACHFDKRRHCAATVVPLERPSIAFSGYASDGQRATVASKALPLAAASLYEDAGLAGLMAPACIADQQRPLQGQSKTSAARTWLQGGEIDQCGSQ